MNTLAISGNLTRDAQLRDVGGKQVLGFSVADNRGKEKQAIFWDCSIWGDRATKLAEMLTKGRHVTVTGSVQSIEVKDDKAYPRLYVNDVDLGPKPASTGDDW